LELIPREPIVGVGYSSPPQNLSPNSPTLKPLASPLGSSAHYINGALTPINNVPTMFWVDKRPLCSATDKQKDQDTVHFLATAKGNNSVVRTRLETITDSW